MKTPYELLARLAPKPTAEDVAAAGRLGVTVDEYRAMKVAVAFEDARKRLPPDQRPADIAQEERIAERLRREPGIIKPRDQSPGVLVQAARAPGEVAKTVIFVLLYFLSMMASVILGGERVHRLPGIFQFLALGVLVVPVMWLTGRIWEGMGEGARNACRALVRFWPLTLVGLVLILGALKLLLGGGR